MKAITVRQPWAWAIMHGGKLIENRTGLGMWQPAVGRRVAIHAGKEWSRRGEESRLIALAYGGARSYRPPRPTSPGIVLAGVIGTVRVVDVHREHGGCCQPWGESSYAPVGGPVRVDVVHLVLEDPRSCDPIPCRGALGLWTLPEDVQDELRETAGQ
jgi:hypothetical protein